MTDDTQRPLQAGDRVQWSWSKGVSHGMLADNATFGVWTFGAATDQDASTAEEQIDG